MYKLTGVMLLKISYAAQTFFWAMPDEPQISLGQALEVFQGQISVKVNGCHVAKNIVRSSNFFCGLCLMSLKSVSVKLWRFFKAK